MIEFGKSLRAAREAKGYTIGQLAELTRLAPRTINELESEDFTHIAAPIYGRGFVKLYCAKVGLDPVPFVSKFMDIYSGNCDVGIRERPTAAAPAESAASVPVSEPEPEPAPQPEPQPEEQQPEPVPAATPSQLDFLADDPIDDKPPICRELKDPRLLNGSRYATPVRPMQQASGLAPSFWRLGILVGAALVLIILVIWGLRVLFAPSGPEVQDEAATASEPSVTRQETARPEQKKTKRETPESAAPTQAQPRKEQKIPSLFID